MLPTLIVFGDKTANEVLEAAQLAYPNSFSSMERVYFEEPTFTELHLPKYRQSGAEVYYNIGVADSPMKQRIHHRCVEIGWRPFTVVHPSAVISPTATLGSGVFVGPLAVVSAYATNIQQTGGNTYSVVTSLTVHRYDSSKTERTPGGT